MTVPDPADDQPAPRLTPALAGIIAVGGILRIIAALILTPHVDEGSSMLAAHAVAATGTPILPSGTVYTQGLSLSFLAAPLVRLGLTSIDDLPWLRMIVVILSTAAIAVAWRLAHAVTGRPTIALLMAGMVALDPLSVQWSATFRMYGALQILSFGIALVWIRILADGVTPRRGVALVLLFWGAVLTHVGAAALIGAALGLAALIVRRWRLLTDWPVLMTLALCALGGIALLLYNTDAGSASVTTISSRAAGKPFSFVGDNLLRPFGIDPADLSIAPILKPKNQYWLGPFVLVMASTVIGGSQLLRHAARRVRIGAIVTLCLYWLPMLAVAIFTNSPKERYILSSHLLGYLFSAVIVAALLDRRRQQRPLIAVRPAWAAPLLSGLLVITVVAGLTWRLTNPVIHPNHNAALEYVAAHHQPGQPIIVALPAIAWIAIPPDDRDDIVFLAGIQDQDESRQYTRLTDDGRLVDYWDGAPAIVTLEELADAYADHPDAWIVVDHDRLTGDWAYRGVMEQYILANGHPVYEGQGGVVVFRPGTAPAATVP